MIHETIVPEPKLQDASRAGCAPICLGPDELEVMQIILQAAEFFGLPKSAGEIYGLLFISEEPLHAEVIQTALQLSKGGTSQGLKMLKDLGAIKVTYMPGGRRDHYTAETHLRNLVSGIILHKVEPALRALDGRLEKLDTPKGGHSKHFFNRVKQLKSWHSKAKKVTPFVREMIAG